MSTCNSVQTVSPPSSHKKHLSRLEDHQSASNENTPTTSHTNHPVAHQERSTYSGRKRYREENEPSTQPNKRHRSNHIDHIDTVMEDNNTLKHELDAEKKQNENARDSLIQMLDRMAMSERREREVKLIENNTLIGRMVKYNDFGTKVSDVWENGHLFDDIKRRRKTLEKQKEDIVCIQKRLTTLQNEDNENNNSNNRLNLDSEIVAIRLNLIEKHTKDLDIEECTLECRKKCHIQFIRLMNQEKKSNFSIVKQQKCPILNDRYALTNLIGRGGFSEVHRGYDFDKNEYIAVKIHELNPQWRDERKRQYVKHATREYDIHKTLYHPNIVQLYNVFAISGDAFGTVIEYCDGMDLSIYFKINKTLNEREAKCLIIQVFSGLKYLHNSNPHIIHFDLKPSNILYKNGQIKLADFGLARMAETEYIELTSQGGTYFYIAPECFQKAPVVVSPKVDIWSAGVVFFEALFGQKPFGFDILNGTSISITFPDTQQTPKISTDAKEFIKECCEYDPEVRLSSKDIVDDHPYFAFLRS